MNAIRLRTLTAGVRNVAIGALLLALPALASVDSALLALVPQDATVIAGAKVEDVKASPFGQYVLKNMQMEDNDFRKFVEETGFDPRRDLREVVMATAGSNSEFDRTVIVGKGVFNPAKIIAAAKGLGADVTTYSGVEMILKVEGKRGGAVAFLDAGLAVLGDSNMVKQVIDRRGKGVAINADTQRRVTDLSAQNHVWFHSSVSPASLFSGRISDPNLGGAVQNGLMESVTQASGGLKFDASGVRISGEATARTDKDATALADVFRFLAGIVAAREPGAQNVVQSLNVSAEGNIMKMTFSVPEAMLEDMFGNGRPKVQRARREAVVD